MNLKEAILDLLRKSSGIAANPILNQFEIEECVLIDEASIADDYIRSQRDKILNMIKKLGVDFVEEYKSIFEIYSETIAYVELKKKFMVVAVSEQYSKTPDFQILYNNAEIYIEHKSLAFSNGILAYRQVQEDSLDANVKLEAALRRGQRIAFASYGVAPLGRDSRYGSYSVKYIIERIINKIRQNIKKDQYSKGNTILMVDLKQIIIPSTLEEASVPFFNFDGVIVSGVLWNVVFGQIGNLVLKTTAWEGSRNIEGQLDASGILTEYNYIKGVIFIGYKNFKEKRLIGFFRREDDQLNSTSFLVDYCSFVNDNLNTCGF